VLLPSLIRVKKIAFTATLFALFFSGAASDARAEGDRIQSPDEIQAEQEIARLNRQPQENEPSPSTVGGGDCEDQIHAATDTIGNGNGDWPYGFFECTCVDPDGQDGNAPLAADCVYKRDYSCFPPETRILMGDGSTKPVDKIKTGDMVWNPALNKAVPVGNRLAGPEKKPLIEIAYEGKSVRVTETHPMIIGVDAASFKTVSLRIDGSSGGSVRVKRASDVTTDDFVLAGDGQFYRVTAARRLPVDEQQIVWNFEIATESTKLEDHMIVADGFATGDVKVQARLNNYQLPWERR